MVLYGLFSVDNSITTTNTNTATSTITDSQLANALITPDDITDITGLGAVRPTLIELSSHLDPTPPTSYTFFDSRSWYSIPSGDQRVLSAVVQNQSAADAKSLMLGRASGQTAIAGAEEIGDNSIMYAEAATDSSAASVTVRFTRDTFANRITVYAVGNETTDDITPLAIAVAQAQDNRLIDFLDNDLPPVESSSSLVSLDLVNLSAATFIGKVPVTEDEWLTVTGEDGVDATVTDFHDAALSRFISVDRLDEVVEVTILNFSNPDSAATYQTELVGNNSNNEIILPATIADVADAIGNSNIVETQMAKGSYVIDVSVFSPFGTLDKAAATDDLIKWTGELNDTFNAE